MIDLTTHWVGMTSMLVFLTAYLMVMFEEKIHLRKSKPVLVAAGIIWILIAIYYRVNGDPKLPEDAIREDFLEYAELFFFLLVAMTYINALIERGVFEQLRLWLIKRGFGYRALFWLTGFLAFFISPIADNLTTALIMCTVVLTVGKDQPKFVGVSCINIVVAANAGGAFSPFGDITTLMVWQSEKLEFFDFLRLFPPSLVNFLIPALFMQWTIAKGRPKQICMDDDKALKYGGVTISVLFLLTIITAVTFHNVLHLPPVYGMMLGLGYLKFYGYYLRRRSRGWLRTQTVSVIEQDPYNFDVFSKVALAEWDTLFFFYGVILAVGGLGFLGYLGLASEYFYDQLGPTEANVLVGLLSAIVDNIPVMFAVLNMDPQMPENQWLLVTLTAGVGGSLLSIGSAAGVALMGQARGQYTFFTHLRWTPIIVLGYLSSIFLHLFINAT